MPSIASIVKTVAAFTVTALAPIQSVLAAPLPIRITTPPTASAHLAKRASQSWPTNVFAPYCDVLLWPTFDVASVATQTGTKFFTLAFITADTAGKPAWGGIVPLSNNFYMSYINKLRDLGGDVAVSFGGLNGQELALVAPSAPELFNLYDSVISTYSLNRVDFDIEGPAVSNVAANSIRAQALISIKKKYPNIVISYTLPVLPTGLIQEGIDVLVNAAQNGLQIDIVNIMAMNYGNGVAPNGATGMGGYAIDAAKATYAQAVAAGHTNVKIGVTPMIGKNDLQYEIFSLSNAAELLRFAQQTPWISMLSYWSINRDTNVYGPLYASSQITQNLFAFADTFKAFDSTDSTNTPTPDNNQGVPDLIRRDPSSETKYNWPSKVFSPYADIVDTPSVDLVDISSKTGSVYYTLAFIVSGGRNNDPYWGAAYPLDQSWYLDQITSIRNFGGDVIVSFGGAAGSELATTNLDVTTLQAKYQNVIDTYALSWVDFDVEGTSLSDTASVDRRNRALRGLQVASPNLVISYTLPVLPSGLTADGVNLLKSARAAGVRVDVVNIMVMNYGDANAPNGATGMGGYAIDAAKATYAQAVAVGFSDVKIGITPMIGRNDLQSEIFTLVNAQQVLQFAQQTPWVSWLSFWSVNRDTSSQTGVAQHPYQFAQTFMTVNN